jgi:orotate phosphoribosyltransferase
MELYQRDFIRLAIEHKALGFGEFTLKSGRVSPYFFNAGRFQTGGAIANLGRLYASALINSGTKFDMLLGPAYKGIPLAASTAIALADRHNRNLPYCYNRKEAKDHGEGGTIVGAPLQGRVIIVDDVITAGTAVREVLSMVRDAGAEAAAVVIGLNRQERGTGARSAIQELEEDEGVPVISIVNLDHIVHYLDSEGNTDTLERVKGYRNNYGI